MHHSDGRTPDWKDLLSKIDNGVDSCSEQSLSIGANPQKYIVSYVFQK